MIGFVVLFIFSTLVTVLFFLCLEGLIYASDYRIQKKTHENGEVRFYIQQKLLSMWVDCKVDVGIETYESVYFNTEDEARAYIKRMFDSLEVKKGWNIRKVEKINYTDKKSKWAKVEDKSDGPSSWTEYTDHDGNTFMMMDMLTMPSTPGAYMRAAVEETNKCKHEMVSTEYSSQPYGHCQECNKTVFRDEDNNWKL